MNHYRVEVAVRPDLPDPMGRAVLADVKDLGVAGVKDVRVADVYLLGAELTAEQARRVAEELLADPVSQYFAVNEPIKPPRRGAMQAVQVFRKPGVMDPVAATTVKAVRDLTGVAPHVRTGRKYMIYGSVSAEDLATISSRVLHNAAIEMVYPGAADVPLAPDQPSYVFRRVEVDILSASDEELLRISRQNTLSLNLEEMRAVRDYFKREGRNPTDAELESLAQTWSEHCNHKTLRGVVEFNGEVIDNLLKSTVFRATRELNKPWCLSVFKDNAGVIEFDEDYGVAFKVETHNHPSAIEPYGGAGTGIGGVIRDPMGTGLGAKPVLNTDVFCFGPPDLPRERTPQGALHPKRVMKGVVAGVRDYGNRMGIPTVNGAVLFDERYTGNPLVYCGNAGLIPKSMVEKAARKGDWVVVVGGRTGRDGIHGATFSSVELHDKSEVVDGGAVQIGNAIEEKRMLDTILQARDRGLYTCITDCGAGGLSSAVGEMGAELGAEVDLERVPLKYQGLSYTEIWISEAQERMVLAVPPERLDELLKVFASENVEATAIGRFTGDGRLRLRYNGVEVANLAMSFLHDGCPRRRLKAVWTPPSAKQPKVRRKQSYGDDLKKILASWNVCSKEWIIRQYDHEVQGGSVVKPLVGAACDGPGDAAIVAPRLAPGIRSGHPGAKG
ncbi:MAG TPA: phosphoribosylformylglycinamidine synthase subunit PurS, partial [Candidatus Brocadiia bacterium]|nr:phosphoribosylformylglycinamidine synthase subunit PurS [Candidatus Brocadiia bacterium]